MRKIESLLFGSSGIPASTEPRNTAQGIRQTRRLGLDAMEMAFVHSVNISEEAAAGVCKVASEENVTLTCHAPYYINLNSDGSKLAASQKRIYDSAHILGLCGGWSVAFHPGFYTGMPMDATYARVFAGLAEVRKTLADEGTQVWLRPETMGKGSQFGSLDEVLRLCAGIEGVAPLIDWGHLQARSNGKINGETEFRSVLEKIERELGGGALKNMHCQVEGIEFSEKGERRHLNLGDGTLQYRELVAAWKEFKCTGVIISESPNQEADALLLQKLYRE